MSTGIDRLAGTGVMLGIIGGWAFIFSRVVRLYENLSHAYNQRRRRKR